MDKGIPDELDDELEDEELDDELLDEEEELLDVELVDEELPDEELAEEFEGSVETVPPPHATSPHSSPKVTANFQPIRITYLSFL